MQKKVIYFTIALMLFSANTFAKNIHITTSIKPLHSLVLKITDGIINPDDVSLIVKQGSVHGYSLKPSDAKIINDSDYIIFNSKELENYIYESTKKAANTKIRIWQDIENIKLIENRAGGILSSEAKDNSHKDHEDEHNHEHKHGHDEHEHHEHDEHHHGKFNPHLWLSIENSKILLEIVANDLCSLDSENCEKYKDNLKNSLSELDNLKADIKNILKNTNGKSYLVFHDAYPYFEAEFDLSPSGIIRVDVDHEPGTKRIANIKKQIDQNKIVCIFSEPQFPAKLVEKLISGTKTKTAVLDPLGADLKPDKNMYNKLMINLANSISSCIN